MTRFNDIRDITRYVSDSLDGIAINQYQYDFDELVWRVSKDFRDTIKKEGYQYGDDFVDGMISDKEFWDIVSKYEIEDKGA